jgi:hypothetical protein
MVRDGSQNARSGREWVLRGVLALALLMLAGMSLARTAGVVFYKGNAELGHQLAPWDGRVTAFLARSLASSSASERQRARSDDLARRALRQEPTAIAATTALGINALTRNDTPEARVAFGYALSLSRRDLPTQLWAIEDAVARDDVPGALRHYDFALRSSRHAPDLLFPILATAIQDPKVRQAVVTVLLGKPRWSDAFVEFLADRGPRPEASALLLLDMRRSGLVVPAGPQAELVDLLARSVSPDRAWAYFAQIRSGATRDQSRDPQFNVNEAARTTFDWSPLEVPGASSSIQRGDKGGVYDFSVPPSLDGPILQQKQLLPQGAYRLEGISQNIDRSSGQPGPYWVLRCEDGRELGRVDVPAPGRQDGAFSGRIVVPQGCPRQVLTFVARSTGAPAGVSGQILRALLLPENRE